MRSAIVIDGRAIAAAIKGELEVEVGRYAAEYGRVPGLATILVGDDSASAVYVAAKHRACEEVGIRSIHRRLPATASERELVELIDELNVEESVDGILCQLPLPRGLDATTVINRIDPGKDVDGLTTLSSGRLASGLHGLRPCTPSGVMVLLAHEGIELDGANAVVIGRSNLFGKPMAQLLLEANATVTVCHSRTRDLPAICRSADILIAAVGRARLVERSWVRPGAVVIDVGITRSDDRLVGDVDFDAVQAVAAAITPVPGGVGPMTIACLLQNTIRAAWYAAAPAAVGAGF
ncbi:MAG: bifunctional methylenetetrahydrofolate dehydrogenase/methenyltetrahydrofolate cyclohydrolase FolD [Solirubrobacteraceae bacterium]